MNAVLASLCFYTFLVLAPVILVIKFTTGRPAWWLILIIIFGLGWGLVAATYFFNQLGINDLITQGKYDELPDGWDSDGASGVFALFGGWLLSLAYFTLWLVIYIIATIIRRLFQLRGAPGKCSQSDQPTAGS